MAKRDRWVRSLESKKERLSLYLDMEKKILTGSTPQAYSIGSRSKTNYNMSASELKSAIEKLETEIEELEGLLSGEKPRKCVGVIPRF